MDSLAGLKRPPSLIVDILHSAGFVTLPLLVNFFSTSFYVAFSNCHPFTPGSCKRQGLLIC